MASPTGLHGSMVNLVPFCRLRMRPLQWHLLAFFRPASRQYSTPAVPVTTAITPHLQWWTQWQNLSLGVRFPPSPPEVTLTTDTSLLGWGAYIGIRPMASPLGRFSYKLPRVRGGSPRFGSVCTSRQRTEGPGSIRQYYSGSLHQSPGRDSLIQPMETVLGPLSMGVTSSDHLGSDTLTRDSQHQGGCSLPSVAAVLRVDVEPNHFLTSSGQMPDLSRGGPVRLTGEQPNLDILQPVSSSASVARECPVIPLEGTRVLRFSTASSIVTRVLLKIEAEGTLSILLIAPFWPARAWFPKLVRLLAGQPFRLPPLQDLLSLPDQDLLYPDPQALALVAWLLQGVLHQGGVFGGSCPYGGTGTSSFHSQPL